MKKLIQTIISLFFTLHCFATPIEKECAQFGLDLYKILNSSEENLIFSPYGAFSTLSLLYFGADGRTAEEMRNTLHLSNQTEDFLKAFQKQLNGFKKGDEKSYKLHISNGLFLQEGTTLNPSFEQLETYFFNASLDPINYHFPKPATEKINGWVFDKTKGKIPQLLKEGDLTPYTRLVAINALYFAGKWSHPFPSKKTHLGPFYLDNRTHATAEMMQQTKALPYVEDDLTQCLFLPFQKKDDQQPHLSCILALPKTTLADLINSLDINRLSQWLKHRENTLIEAVIPKFCFRNRHVLDTPLQNLGVTQAFSSNCDFSKIDSSNNLFLNSFLQETYFSFDEHGVTAAAATAANMGLTAATPQIDLPTPFIADHPFLLFVIDEHSQTILFMGHITNPSMGGKNAN